MACHADVMLGTQLWVPCKARQRPAPSPPPPTHVVKGVRPSKMEMSAGVASRRRPLPPVRCLTQAVWGPATGHSVTSYLTQVPPFKGGSVGGTSLMTTMKGLLGVPVFRGALAAGVTNDSVLLCAEGVAPL